MDSALSTSVEMKCDGDISALILHVCSGVLHGMVFKKEVGGKGEELIVAKSCSVGVLAVFRTFGVLFSNTSGEMFILAGIGGVSERADLLSIVVCSAFLFTLEDCELVEGIFESGLKSLGLMTKSVSLKDSPPNVCKPV